MKGQEQATPLRAVDHLVDAQYLGEETPPPGARLADHWRTVVRYRWSVLLIALLAAAVGVMTAVSAVPLYRAEARLLVKFNQPNVSNLQQFESTPLHWLYFETQADIIKSRAVAIRVVEALEAGAVPAPAEPTEVRRPSLRERIGAYVPDWRAWLPAEWRTPPAPPPTPEEARAQRVDQVMGGLGVTGGKESEVLVVSYVSPDPVRAAQVANETARAYIGFGLDSRVSNVQQTTVWLGERIEELREKLATSEAMLRDFQAREGMVDTQSRESIISAKLGSLSAELVRAQSRRSDAEARHSQLRRALDSQADPESLAALVDNPMVLEAHRAKRLAERTVVELDERYGDKHPKMIAAKAERADARQRFQLEVDKAAGSVRKELELARSQEREIRRIIDAQQSEMRSLSGKAFELGKLEREMEANRKLYETFLGRFKEAHIAEDYDVPQARIIDHATVPAYPFRPDKRRMVMIAVMIGLALGIGLAFLRDHLDSTFTDRGEVEDRLRLPVLGQVPKLRARLLGGATPERCLLDNPRSPFSERINDVRTAIMFCDVDRPPKSVLVTSAVPGEGKSTLASNLAMGFRQRGRTLLIDADLRRGRIGSIFGREGPGLTDRLTGGATAAEAIMEIEEAPGLYLMLPGRQVPNPLEVVASKRFETELARLVAAFDHVVIDSSPLLPVSDSIVIGRQVDAVVLTLKAGSTPHDAGLEAVRRLQSAQIKPAGVVLQQVDLSKSRRYSRRYASAYSRYYEYQTGRSGA